MDIFVDPRYDDFFCFDTIFQADTGCKEKGTLLSEELPAGKLILVQYGGALRY